MKLTQFTHGIKKLFTGNKTEKRGPLPTVTTESPVNSSSLESKLTLSNGVLSKVSSSTVDPPPENKATEAKLTTRPTKSLPREEQDLGIPVGGNQRVWENSNGTLFTADTTLYGQVRLGADGQFEAIDLNEKPKERAVSQPKTSSAESKPASNTIVEPGSLNNIGGHALHGQLRWNENGELVYR